MESHGRAGTTASSNRVMLLIASRALSPAIRRDGPQRRATSAVGKSSLRYTALMGKLEKIEREIQNLSPGEIAELREWFAAFDAEAWDRQFEADAGAGKLDALADAARNAHEAGKTTKI